MTKVAFVKTPGGEELAILPRAEFEELQEALEHSSVMAAYRAGRMPGLTSSEALELANASSPLAFWRAKRGITQKALAEQVGVTGGHISQIEKGLRSGDVALWRKMAHALDLPLDAILPDED